jgi:hypothetical protein
MFAESANIAAEATDAPMGDIETMADLYPSNEKSSVSAPSEFCKPLGMRHPILTSGALVLVANSWINAGTITHFVYQRLALG